MLQELAPATADQARVATVDEGAARPRLSWATAGELRIPPAPFDILPDGCLVGIQREDEGGKTEPEIVFNFFDELNARLSAAKRRL